MKKLTYISLIILQIVHVTLPAQSADSIFYFKSHAQGTHFLYVPAALIVSGVVLNDHGEEAFRREIVEARNASIPKFKTHVDDYLQLAPIGIAYGLDIFGVKSKNDFINKSIILLKGEALMTVTVFGLKKLTHQLRPDNSAYNSFPSGHTAQAFAGATFLTEEYKDKIKWMPYFAYGIASSVGILRMANNKHYISDVLAGAGFGILSMKLSYITHQYKWGRKRITNNEN